MSIIREITFQSQLNWKTEEILIFIGARQAGKTTILHQIRSELEKDNKKCFWLNLEDPEYLNLLNENPKNLWQIFDFAQDRRNFLFIDEIQYLKNPTNFLKYFYDEHRDKIKLIVSGSSSFYLDKKFKDSLVGRKKIFPVHTLSFNEFLRFKEKNELSKKNFKQLSLNDRNKIVSLYQEFMIFGGYPRVALAESIDEKKELLAEIAFSYIKKDILEANIRQDEIFYKLFKILANQVGNLVNAMELANTLGVSKTAIDNYLYVMQKSFHLVLIPPFSQNIQKEITKMPKVYFLDTGLRNFFADNFEVWQKRTDRGQLLENATFRQLLEKYPLEEVRFWRTITQKEVDFVVGKNAFEVKTEQKKFQPKKYQTFLEAYPDFNLSIIAYDSPKDKESGYKVLNVWEV